MPPLRSPIPFMITLGLLSAVPAALANDTALHPGAFGPEPVGGGITGNESVIEMATEQMTKDAKGVDDAMYAELARHFEESEIVELATVIGLFNYFNRVNDALRVDITR